MVGDLYAGYKGFTAILDGVKRLKEINDATIRNTVTLELTEKILAAQESQAALVRRIDELEKQLVQFENWEREKENYELHEVRDGSFVYRQKDSVNTSERPHKICSQCYEKRHKSILQQEIWNPGRCNVLICNSCGSMVYLSGSRSTSHPKITGGR